MRAKTLPCGLATLLTLALAPTAGAADQAESAEPTADCEATAPDPSNTVSAASSRNRSVEALGLTLTDDLTVPEKLYQRLERDIRAIKAQNTALIEIDHRPEYDASSLLVEAADASTAQAIRNGRYEPWQCLKQQYGQQAVHHMFGKHFDIRFDGVFDMEQLGNRYTELSGIVHTNLNLNVGDGSTIAAQRQGETFTYHFIEQWGDCVSGCIESRTWQYEVNAQGSVELISEPGPGAPRPPASR